MQKILRFFLASDRNRRCWSASIAIRLLRLLRDAESDEARRLSCMLDEIDADALRRKYIAVEDECLCCESALEFLNSAIEDLKFAY